MISGIETNGARILRRIAVGMPSDSLSVQEALHNGEITDAQVAAAALVWMETVD